VLIEPKTEVMQRHLRRQASLEPRQGMGALPFQAEDRIQLAKDGLHDLTQSSQPAAQRLRPGMTTRPPGTANHPAAVVQPPLLMPGPPFKAGVDDLHPTDRLADIGQARIKLMTPREKGLGQGLIFGAGRSEAKASNHSAGRRSHQQMKALIPAEPIAPANICLPSQPASSSTFGITGGHRRAIQRLIGIIRAEQSMRQMQGKGDDCIAVLTLQAIELRTSRQVGKGCPQVTLGIAVEGPFALKVGPLSKERQGHHLTPAQAGRWARPRRLGWQGGLVKVINHHVQCRKVGSCVHQRLAPSLEDWVQANPKTQLPFFQVWTMQFTPNV